MNYVGSIISNFKGFYQEINSATLNGSIDVVIVKQADGSYVSSPFHVRFGKIGVLRSREKLVDIVVNGNPVPLHMKLGEAGEAFFVEQISHNDIDLPAYLATSPMPDPAQTIMEEGMLEFEAHPEYWTQKELPNPTSSDPITTATTTSGAPGGVEGDLQTCTTAQNNSDLDPSKHLSFPGATKLRPNRDTRRRRRKQKGSANQLADAQSPTTTTSPTINPADQSPFTAESDEDTLFAMDMSSGSDSQESVGSTASAPCLYPSSAGAGTGGGGGGMSCRPDVLQGAEEYDTRQHNNTTLINNEWHGSQFASGCHPFSDGDITPTTSPIGTRPPTPKSDTEYELGENCSSRLRKSSITETPEYFTKKRPSSLIDGLNTEWKWGELPTSSTTPCLVPSSKCSSTAKSSKASSLGSTCSTGTPGTGANGADGGAGGILADEVKEEVKPVEKTSGGLFNFMRRTKKLRHRPSQEGIYLDDLDLEAMDPEVAALYLCPSKRASKSQSAKKTSTTSSSTTKERASLAASASAEDFSSTGSTAVNIDAMSVDGEDAESGTGDSLPRSPEPSIIHTEFDSTKVSIDNMSIGCDIKLSLCGGHLDNEHYVKEEIFYQYIVTKQIFQETPDILFNSNLVVKIKDKYYNWQVAGPQIISLLAFQTELPSQSLNTLKKKHMPKKERKRWWWSRTAREPSLQVKETSSETSLATTRIEDKNDARDCIVKKNSSASDLSKTINLSLLDASVSKDDTDDSENVISDASFNGCEFKKSLKLNSSQIEQLGLKQGMNEVQYSVTTMYQGTTRIKSFIYLWNWDDRIIVSDIDGTITKSDVLGHVLPMIGKDWSQAGIARLYTQAASNGYKFLYLSARAIGQARITRDYLSSIVQQGDVVLPVGPMLLSPSSLISAFHKEVIEKKPEEFKIGCLRDIKALFPACRNPFYAGFGNKINDVWAYTAVGIPIPRIFTVNYRGELRQEKSTVLNSTYSELCDIVDHVFPPLVKRKRGYSEDAALESSELFPNCDHFSSFTYWRTPVQDIDELELLTISGSTPSSTTASTTTTTTAPTTTTTITSTTSSSSSSLSSSSSSSSIPATPCNSSTSILSNSSSTSVTPVTTTSTITTSPATSTPPPSSTSPRSTTPTQTPPSTPPLQQ